MELSRLAAKSVAVVRTRTLPTAAAVELVTFAAATIALMLTHGAVRRAEALARQNATSLGERAQELNLFAGRVAHDLLSPLMTVAVALHIAGRKLTLPDDARRSRRSSAPRARSSASDDS